MLVRFGWYSTTILFIPCLKAKCVHLVDMPWKSFVKIYQNYALSTSWLVSSRTTGIPAISGAAYLTQPSDHLSYQPEVAGTQQKTWLSDLGSTVVIYWEGHLEYHRIIVKRSCIYKLWILFLFFIIISPVNHMVIYQLIVFAVWLFLCNTLLFKGNIRSDNFLITIK